MSQPRVLSNSLLLGYPYADVAEMGSSVVVVTDNVAPLAERFARQLTDYLWSHRQECLGEFIDVDEALRRAVQLPPPVCLLDMGDNVSGGSPADGTVLAHALHARRLGESFVCLFDPESVKRATTTGPGARVELTVGGKTDQRHSAPLRAEFIVRSLHGGKFQETQPRHGGITEFDMGHTALVRADSGLNVMLTTRRIVPFSLQQLISCGLDPAAFRILVAKGVVAPVAAYQAVCRHLIRVNTPGSTCADMTQLSYRQRRQPMFPFERDMAAQPTAIVCGC